MPLRSRRAPASHESPYPKVVAEVDCHPECQSLIADDSLARHHNKRPIWRRDEAPLARPRGTRRQPSNLPSAPLTPFGSTGGLRVCAGGSGAWPLSIGGVGGSLGRSSSARTVLLRVFKYWEELFDLWSLRVCFKRVFISYLFFRNKRFTLDGFLYLCIPCSMVVMTISKLN